MLASSLTTSQDVIVRYMCTLCGVETLKENVEKHAQVHIVDGSCKACGVLDAEPEARRLHVYQHLRRRLECPTCGDIYETLRAYRAHTHNEVANNTFVRKQCVACTLCGHLFPCSESSRALLAEHVLRHSTVCHTFDDELLTDRVESIGPTDESECNENQSQHDSSDTGDRNDSSLQPHSVPRLVTYDTQIVSAPSGNKDNCNSKYVSSGYAQQKGVNHDERNSEGEACEGHGEDGSLYVCLLCSHAFKLQSELRKHIVKHLGNKHPRIHICTCGKIYNHRHKVIDYHIKEKNRSETLSWDNDDHDFHFTCSPEHEIEVSNTDSTCKNYEQALDEQTSKPTSSPVRDSLGTTSVDSQSDESREKINTHEITSENSHRTTSNNRSAKSDTKQPLVCNICGKHFRSSGWLERHRSTHTPVTNTSHVDRNKTSRKGLKNPKDVGDTNHSKHAARGFKDKDVSLSCGKCPRVFRSRAGLRDHELLAHSDVLNELCNLCGVTFKTRHQLHQHIRKHQATVECPTCKKLFTTKKKMQGHMNKNGCHRCEVCGQMFKQRFNLHLHRSIHTGEKPHQCPTCGKTFRTKYYLEDHLRVHQGLRRYQCEQCSQKFQTSSALRRHMRTHTGEKPYVCSECGKAFSLQPNLNRHMRIHYGEKYNCPLCSRQVTERSNLVKHLRVHERRGERVPPGVQLVQVVQKKPVENQDTTTTCSSTTSGAVYSNPAELLTGIIEKEQMVSNQTDNIHQTLHGIYNQQ